MKVVGCTISSLQAKVNIFQFNINWFATHGINYFNQLRDSSITRGGMEAIPPRGNQSVVPRDHSYTNAHSGRQCEFTFQPVNPRYGAHPGVCQTKIVSYFGHHHSLARETRRYPGFRVQMGGHGGPPLLQHLVGTGVPAGPFPGFLDGPE
jgi:hypothetical protein